MSRAPLLLLALALQGCIVHRVRVESEPPGAVVRVDGKVRGVTPVEFTVPWTPPLTKKYNVRVSLPGYRSAEAMREAWYLPSPLRRQVRMWRYLLHPFRWGQILGRTPRTTVRYVLVPEHGPAGTWEPEDVR
ncbi:MAG: PEGA domain-containing protein [Alphaproteobacteria bacterium]|nr:PEGA domain-containing protein [Alphaproteobacteria bacterium]